MIQHFEIFPDLYFFDIADSAFLANNSEFDGYDTTRKLTDEDVYNKILKYGPKLIRVWTRDCFPMQISLEISNSSQFASEKPKDVSYVTHSTISLPSNKIEFRGSTADTGPQFEFFEKEASMTIFHCCCNWEEHFLHGTTEENYVIQICPVT